MRRHSANAVASALLLTLVAAISSGCQTFVPGNFSGLSASRQEKRILKQAEVDPFPSPADVGLSAPASTP